MRAIQENQECALNSITVGIDKIRLPNGTPSLETDADSLTWNKKYTNEELGSRFFYCLGRFQ